MLPLPYLRDLSQSDNDGVHPKVRLGQACSCVLVLMGVRTTAPRS